MSITISSVTINCPDDQRLAAFYAEILSGSASQIEPGWSRVTTAGARLDLLRVDGFTPVDWPAATALVHLDLAVDDLAGAEAQVLAAGATRFDPQPAPEEFIVYLDPAGNPFCLITDVGAA